MTGLIRMWTAFAVMFLGPAGMWPSETEPLTPVGRWKTIDDKTGKPKSIVQIYVENGRFFGRVEATLNPDARKVCDLCKDERKNQPIVGMVIMRGLSQHGDEYSGGDIVDPDNGSVYRCKLHLQDGGRELLVRGYIGISLLGRSQTWTRQP
jgi:uncharacterized protein (DUF2147 family)